MKLSQLRDFIAIAEHGSLRAAARALGVTPPALMKSVNGLEAELHVPLLVRSSRGVALSDYGSRFLQRARLIQTEAQKAADEISEMRGRYEGTVTIGASPTPSLVLLPDALVQFRRKFPKVRINILGGMYHSHLRSIRSGAMDLAVSPVPEGGLDAAFRCEPLFYNDIVIVARRGHPQAGVRSLAELADCEWVLTGPATQGPGAAIFDVFRSHGLEPPRRMMQCDVTWTLETLLLNSDLMCALPRQLLQHGTLSERLCIVPVREPLPRYAVSLIYRSDVPLLPTIDYLATLMRRQACHVGRHYPGLVPIHGAADAVSGSCLALAGALAQLNLRYPERLPGLEARRAGIDAGLAQAARIDLRQLAAPPGALPPGGEQGGKGGDQQPPPGLLEPVQSGGIGQSAQPAQRGGVDRLGWRGGGPGRHHDIIRTVVLYKADEEIARRKMDHGVRPSFF